MKTFGYSKLALPFKDKETNLHLLAKPTNDDLHPIVVIYIGYHCYFVMLKKNLSSVLTTSKVGGHFLQFPKQSPEITCFLVKAVS